MKWRPDELTSTDDYNWRTLLWCMRHGDWWFTVNDDKRFFGWDYIWYDGPIWALRVGPLCMVVST